MGLHCSFFYRGRAHVYPRARAHETLESLREFNRERKTLQARLLRRSCQFVLELACGPDAVASTTLPARWHIAFGNADVALMFTHCPSCLPRRGTGFVDVGVERVDSRFHVVGHPSDQS